jgi:hypothetical protein
MLTRLSGICPSTSWANRDRVSDGSELLLIEKPITILQEAALYAFPEVCKDQQALNQIEEK